MLLYNVFQEFFQGDKLRHINDLLPKNPKYKEQALIKLNQLNERGFVCEIDLEDDFFKVDFNDIVVIFNVDAMRVYLKDDIIYFEGYDYMEGTVKFLFNVPGDTGIKFSRFENDANNKLQTISMRLEKHK